jgi:hypothetical protein
MYKFGKESKKILNTVNKYLVMAAEKTIAESKIDISIPEWGGKRTADYQYSLYKKKWSKADGTVKKSKHQILDDEGKSKALDLCAFVNGEQNWNKERLVYIATLMIKNFDILKKEGKIPNDLHIHSGMFWKVKKGDEEDGFGFDRPHTQLSTTPQTNIFLEK